MITGQNGILNQATKAKEETEKASIEEKVSMAWSAVKSTEYINSNQNIDKSSYYLENLKKELALNGDVEDFNYVENGISTLKYKIKDENEYWYVKIPSLGKAILVKAGRGMIDPAPLWDEDGKVYLVHAWAGSRAALNSVITICEMNAEGTKVISDPVLVFDGNDGINHTIEGPKLYKRNGYYYIFAPAG